MVLGFISRSAMADCDIETSQSRQRPLNNVAQYIHCLKKALNSPDVFWTLCSMIFTKARKLSH
jgi:hypothetical protein